MKLTIAEAARRAGIERSTLYRKIKEGIVSIEKSPDGGKRIDLSELLRVYPDASRSDTLTQRSAKRSIERIEQSGESSAVQRENDVLREQIRTLQDDKTDLKAERDRLLKVIEDQAAQLRQITDQRAREPVEPSSEPVSASAPWWRFWRRP